jgi:hypothetical protein
VVFIKFIFVVAEERGTIQDWQRERVIALLAARSAHSNRELENLHSNFTVDFM